ncbi:MAG: STAS domain-containing protein [Planctomycetota bacterium]
MPNFPYTLAGPDEQILVLECPPFLDHASADELRAEAIRLLPDRDGAGLVLDMSGCHLVTSIGIAALLQIDEFCSDRSAPFCLTNIEQPIDELLGMLNLTRKFTICSDREEAVDWAATL